jgi:hypothetical protein
MKRIFLKFLDGKNGRILPRLEAYRYRCVFFRCFSPDDFILKHWDSTINNWDLVKRELIFDEMWEYSAHPNATLPSTRGISQKKCKKGMRN